MRALILALVVFASFNASSKNWEDEDQYRPGFITGTLDFIDSAIGWVQRECSVIVTAVQNAQYSEKISEALKAGRLKLIKSRLSNRSAQNLLGEIRKDGRVSEKYPYERLKKIFQDSDELYGIDGHLVRYRKSDDTAFVIPREIEKHLVLSMVLTRDDIAKARSTWADDNFFPRHQLLKKYARIFSGPKSTWRFNRKALIYEVEFDGQKPNPDKPFKMDRVTGFVMKFVFHEDGSSEVSLDQKLRWSEESNSAIHRDIARYFMNEMRLRAPELDDLWETFSSESAFLFLTDEDLGMMLEKLNVYLNNGRLNFDVII